MPTLTIRNLNKDTVDRLKTVAKVHGRSMEQEVRTLLESRYAPKKAVIERIRARWEQLPPVAADDAENWINEGRK